MKSTDIKESENNVEFQVEDVMHRAGNVIKVAGRCCDGVISVGDTFEFIYLRQSYMEEGHYRESDGEKFPILIKVLGIERSRRSMDKIYGSETGLLKVKVLRESEIDVEPKVVFRKNDKDRPVWDRDKE